jgi:hypothetical protein
MKKLSVLSSDVIKRSVFNNQHIDDSNFGSTSSLAIGFQLGHTGLQSPTK